MSEQPKKPQPRPQTPEGWKALRKAHGGEIPPLEPQPLGSPPQRVVVVGFDMSLSNMVELMIKLGIASIPAALILAVLYAVAWTFLTSLVG